MSLLSHNLQAFVSIVQHQTVHGAAAELGITQTGVTQRIRALETELSTTLFIRSRRGMNLTSEGQALFRYCQAAKDLEGEALAQIVGGAEASEVRIAISGPTSVMSSRVVPQCMPVLKKFENLLFTFQVNDLDSRIEDLRAGTVHLAIVSPTQVAREMDSKMMKLWGCIRKSPSFSLVSTTPITQIFSSNHWCDQIAQICDCQKWI